MPETFRYFMTEFEHRNLFMTFDTLVNILNSISLTDEEKRRYLKPYSLKSDIELYLAKRHQNKHKVTDETFDVFKTFKLPKN